MLSFHGVLNVKLTNCVFQCNTFVSEVIQMTDLLSTHIQNTITIMNTSFYIIKSNYSLIHISSASLYLEGPVIFNQVKAARILQSFDSNIIFHNYMEFSQNMVTLTDRTKYIIVQENTLINMTDNKYSKLEELNPEYYKAYSVSNFTAPCYYQYTASGQNFDKLILKDKLNFTIMLHNDMFIHTLMTAHCRWLTFSAFNNTKPTIINNELIESDFPLTYKKLFCCCSSDKLL